MRTSVALECSTDTPTLALAVEGGEVVEQEISPRGHARELLPTLSDMLRAQAVEPGDITKLFVGTGPGSYTGLRVAIATALGLMRGAGAALVGVPSVDALLFAELEEGQTGAWTADARGERVYWTRQRRTRDGLECLVAPRLLRFEELESELHDGDRLFGEEAVLVKAAAAKSWRQAIDSQSRPRATSLLRLGSLRLARGEVQAVESLEPLYLREFRASVRRR